ncbi:hypothetical protein SAMN05661044_01177 [Olivibacter domesticus]|uniref:Abi-like protein n=1 Tax=Olivibacter domesticus TaxID=407022 RepID=A0A1H7JZC2_OLID1|nr:hypothetical protein SAMN05661044_01177 [Olivibacter domesticus]
MYDKKAFTIKQQIEQLIERGLIITETGNIAHFLSLISYYRLAGYWRPILFLPRTHVNKNLNEVKNF